MKLLLIMLISITYSFGQGWGGNASKDATTDAATTIDFKGKMLHAGNQYHIGSFVELGSGDSLIVTITTPNTTKWLHFLFDISSNLGVTTELWEGATSTTGGTNVAPLNNQRNSTNTSGAVIARDPTVVLGTATRIEYDKWGASRNFGGSVSKADEFVLKQNTIYVRKIYSNAASNVIRFKAYWHEYTNK